MPDKQYSDVCGTAIPFANPHAISVSFPKMSDVILYEEQDAELLQKMQSGYPRFFRNRLVQQAIDYIETNELDGKISQFIPLANTAAYQQVCDGLHESFPYYQTDIINGIIVPRQTDTSGIRKFLQNTGMIPSSRQAEQFLFNKRQIPACFQEEVYHADDPGYFIKKTLASSYGTITPENIMLTSSGMSAIYAVFEAIKRRNGESRKNVFVQLGWLYLDTMDILSKYGKSKIFFDCEQPEAAISYIRQNHNNIAALFTEVPTNPLLHKPDLERIAAVAKEFDIPVVIDSSLGSAYAYELTEFADVIVESLTKFACGGADIMMGAAIFTRSSNAQALISDVKNLCIAPFEKDVMRLAHEISNYKERIITSSNNASALTDYLKTKKQVRKVFTAPRDKHRSSDEQIMPAVISILFDKDLSTYYDHLQFAKGPSFGTSFTLAMAYVYLAHYGLIKSMRGKKILKAAGLDAELLRLSVGTEPIDSIIRAFEEVFRRHP